MLCDLAPARAGASGVVAVDVGALLAGLHLEAAESSPPGTPGDVGGAKDGLLNGGPGGCLGMRGSRAAVVVPPAKAVGPRCGLGVHVLVVKNRANLALGLIPHVTVGASVLSDPCLRKNRRIESSHHSDVSALAGRILLEDNIADLESAVGLVAGPGIRYVGKVALKTLIPKRPSPGRPWEVAGGEGLAPLVVRRKVVTASDESRTVGIGGRVDQPAVPVGPIVKGPAIGLRVADISNVGVVPGAGCCVLRYSHFDLFSRWSSRSERRVRE